MARRGGGGKAARGAAAAAPTAAQAAARAVKGFRDQLGGPEDLGDPLPRISEETMQEWFDRGKWGLVRSRREEPLR